MMTSLAVAALTEGGKAAAKVGSKVVCYVGGTLIGYGVSQAVMPAIRKNMDKYMSNKFGAEAWQQAQATNTYTKEMQDEINWYNIEATAVNGLCNAVGAIASAFADGAVTKAINNSNATGSSSFTIGNNFMI